MYFTGIIIAVCTFLTIGIWHPIVIKTEYYWGTRPWIVYLLIGISANASKDNKQAASIKTHTSYTEMTSGGAK